MISLVNFYKVLDIKSLTSIKNTQLQFSVDNRQLSSESIFIVIVGERFNPLEHLDQVVESGCRLIVYEKNEKSQLHIDTFEGDLSFYGVSSIEKFIADAGSMVAKQFRDSGGKIIAISGSNGKTTTKEMLFHLLTSAYGMEKVICTQKNNNNHLGVPFTLFQINGTTSYAIVELGSNHPGEIEFLCKLLLPQYGVTTNIGDTHLEFFQTTENVFREESILHKYCSEKFFVNMDDKFLRELQGLGTSYGESSKQNTMIYKDEGMFVDDLLVKHASLTGKHNFINMSVALLIAKSVGPCPINNLLEYVQTFKETSNRSEWVTRGAQNIFLDAYNANPSSMKASIEGFIEYLEKENTPLSEAIFVLGDMNELGSDTKKYHNDLGRFIRSMSVVRVAFVGVHRDEYSSGYSGECYKFEDVSALKKQHNALFSGCKYIFIKGSRSLQLESILDIK